MDTTPYNNLRVVCRFRPVNEREKKERQWNKLGASVDLIDDHTVQVVFDKKGMETQTYTFDHLFYKPTTTQVRTRTLLSLTNLQREVYDKTARETIEYCCEGQH